MKKQTGSDRLANFMEQYFPIAVLRKEGFFDKEKMGRRDYEAMAKRVCEFFGISSVFEYANLDPFGPFSNSMKVEPVEAENVFSEN